MDYSQPLLGVESAKAQTMLVLLLHAVRGGCMDGWMTHAHTSCNEHICAPRLVVVVVVALCSWGCLGQSQDRCLLHNLLLVLSQERR